MGAFPFSLAQLQAGVALGFHWHLQKALLSGNSPLGLMEPQGLLVKVGV